MKEVWKDVVGYEGMYEISSCGNVRRSAREKPHDGTYPKRPIKPVLINRYFRVALRGKKPRRGFSVHRLVATAFIPNPENKPQINHKNCNKFDNRVENLEWCTAKENAEHARQNGKYFQGEKVHLSKLKVSDIVKIRKLYKTGNYYQRELAKMFGVTQGIITVIVNRKIWKSVN